MNDLAFAFNWNFVLYTAITPSFVEIRWFQKSKVCHCPRMECVCGARVYKSGCVSCSGHQFNIRRFVVFRDGDAGTRCLFQFADRVPQVGNRRNEVRFSQAPTIRFDGRGSGVHETAWGFHSRITPVRAPAHPRQGPPQNRISRVETHVTSSHSNQPQGGNILEDIRAFARQMLPSIKEKLLKRFAEEARIASRFRGRAFCR